MFRLLVIYAIIASLQSFYVGAIAASDSSPLKGAVAISRPAANTMPATVKTSENTAQEQIKLIWGVEINACRFGGDEANRLAREGVLIGSDSVSNYLHLEGGNVLLNPDRDIVVGTSEGEITVKTGASVFISQNGDDVVIYDLLQTQPNQVIMKAANQEKIVLVPGRMLVVTKQQAESFEKLQIDCHRVDYTDAVALNFHNLAKGFTANFSIASAMAQIEPLKESVASVNEHDELVTDKLVKGAVVLGGLAATLPATDTKNDSIVAAAGSSEDVNEAKLASVKVVSDVNKSN